MAVTAKLNRLRMSPRKVRLVADAIRGSYVDEAEIRLTHMPKRAALPILKLLKSAIANARHNAQRERTHLFVSEIRVDAGPMLKRFRPRAFGRAAQIKKRVSNITLSLDERSGIRKKLRFVVKDKKMTTAPSLGELEKTSEEAVAKDARETRKFAPQTEKTTDIRKRVADIGRRFFRRKSV